MCTLTLSMTVVLGVRWLKLFFELPAISSDLNPRYTTDWKVDKRICGLYIVSILYFYCNTGPIIGNKIVSCRKIFWRKKIPSSVISGQHQEKFKHAMDLYQFPWKLPAGSALMYNQSANQPLQTFLLNSGLTPYTSLKRSSVTRQWKNTYICTTNTIPYKNYLSPSPSLLYLWECEVSLFLLHNFYTTTITRDKDVIIEGGG